MSTAPRILVVDDEKLIRWSVQERLTRSGYLVSAVECGEEALQAIASDPPQVMLLDVRLPGIGGAETLQRALATQPELVVLLMSAHATVDVAVEGMKHGAIDFLVKPFSLVTLDAAVKRALDAASTRQLIGSSRSVDPDVARTDIIGESFAIARVRDIVARVAATQAATILIEGESGTGKEVVAAEIHAHSSRADKPFLCVNCAAVPEQLLESELFGYERGAFTDARVAKAGLFEAAVGGTIMLDEIGDMPPAGQAKLLRLLENRKFRRVGGVTEMDTDVRVIAATNVDLEQRVSEGLFRPDLYFRLNVVRVRLPPLRDRKEDIPLLAAHFIGRYNAELKCNVVGVSPRALEMMMEYQWPGNCRELRNVIERALILHRDLDEVQPEHLPDAIRAAPDQPASAGAPAAEDPGNVALGAMERRMIVAAMHKSGGNRSQAARLLGISRYTLRYRLKKHALE